MRDKKSGLWGKTDFFFPSNKLLLEEKKMQKIITNYVSKLMRVHSNVPHPST